MFNERVPVEPGLNVATPTRETGPSSIKSYPLLLSPLVVQDVLVQYVLTCPAFSSREVLCKALAPKQKPILDFHLIGLLLFQSFVKFSSGALSLILSSIIRW